MSIKFSVKRFATKLCIIHSEVGENTVHIFSEKSRGHLQVLITYFYLFRESIIEKLYDYDDE